MTTEFQDMIDTLRGVGVKCTIHWDPALESEDLRKTLDNLLRGYRFEVTPSSLIAIVTGDLQYYFSTGEPHWTTYEDDPADFTGHRGWGDPGMFLFWRNSRTGENSPRVFYKGGTREIIAEGRAALEKTHGPIPQYTPRSPD